MSEPDWLRSRFDSDGEDPMATLANLVDVMLVVICGLIAVLFGLNPDWQQQLQQRQQQMRPVQTGRELPRLPDGSGDGGSGLESVGTVYRDPKTGKLILVDRGAQPSP